MKQNNMHIFKENKFNVNYCMNGELLGQSSTYLASFKNYYLKNYFHGKFILGQKDFKVFGFSTLLACLNAMTKIDLLAQPPKNI